MANWEFNRMKLEHKSLRKKLQGASFLPAVAQVAWHNFWFESPIDAIGDWNLEGCPHVVRF